MISRNKRRIYKKYNGAIDEWARSGSKKEKSLMNDDDWYLINELVQDLTIVNKGLASNSFMNSVREKLRENCDSEETMLDLRELISNV